jgi:hypothetical protein
MTSSSAPLVSADSGSSSPEETYRRRAAAFEAARKQLADVSFRFSLLRGVLFLGFAGCLLTILIQGGRGGAGWGWGAGLLLTAFLAVLPFHERIIRRERRAQELVRINEESLARLSRSWDEIPLPNLLLPEVPPLARDLNLFGRASLTHLLGTVHSPPGKPILVRWLLEPAAPAEILERQAAVAELAGDLEFRQQLELRTRMLEKGNPEIGPFLEWAEGRPWLLARPGILWTARALALVSVGLGLAALLTPLPGSFFFLAATVNLAFSFFHAKPMSEAFHRASAREREFLFYAEAMEIAATKVAGTPALAPFARALAEEGTVPAQRAMESLDQRTSLADVRHSTLLHTPLQLLVLWDFHSLFLLEKWQAAHGPRARPWLESLGRLEGLSAFAGLRSDNPDWTFPRVDPGADRLAARGLGHPLLPAGQRVDNDVEVGPADTFLLVTGSNMSGKSTLLRSVGINAVLAQAGAPVAAASLILPPVTLATSILIEDSLADGVSFFMAELLRIQQIVRLADQAPEGRTILYLLDEILRGTNSEERQVAVRRVVLHLLRRKAIGAVPTHDLRLADLPDLDHACRPVHFQETLHPGAEGAVMTFDYKMRPGVATTTNALKLLELLGLDLPQ